jgi:plastocyanin domain-containing protein
MQSVSAVTTGAVQTCLECATKNMPAMVPGSAQVVNGVQVVSIAIEGGTYVPNKIAVKAGMPVQVVFAGSAKGCLAKPMFKSLGKSGDVTTSGTATIDLGALPKGTYKFTCAMGMNAGSIIVQ